MSMETGRLLFQGSSVKFAQTVLRKLSPEGLTGKRGDSGGKGDRWRRSPTMVRLLTLGRPDRSRIKSLIKLPRVQNLRKCSPRRLLGNHRLASKAGICC